MASKKSLLAILFTTIFILNLFTSSSFAGAVGPRVSNLITSTGGTGGGYVMSFAAASNEYLKYGKPRLMYVRPWNANNSSENRKLKLIYSIANGPYNYLDFKAIDAVTGNPLNSAGKEFSLNYEKIGEQDKDFINKIPVDLPIPLNENEAKAIALKEALKYNIVLDDNQNYSILYNDNWSGINKKVFLATWLGKSQDNKINVKITVDALTGSILEFHYTSKTNDASSFETDNITWQEGREKAMDFVKTNFPQYLGNLVSIQGEPINNSTLGDSNYHYCFWRTVNGVLYPENNVTIDVNNKMGCVVGYGYRWENTDFPAIGEGVISEAKAADVFITKIGLKLVDADATKDDDNKLIYASPIYTTNKSDAAYIDAYTGNLMDSKGRILDNDK